MANKTLEERLIDKAYELQEQYQGLLEIRQANRNSLRDLTKQGMLSSEQVTEVNEIYPERAARGSSNTPETAAA